MLFQRGVCKMLWEPRKDYVCVCVCLFACACWVLSLGMIRLDSAKLVSSILDCE